MSVFRVLGKLDVKPVASTGRGGEGSAMGMKYMPSVKDQKALERFQRNQKKKQPPPAKTSADTAARKKTR